MRHFAGWAVLAGLVFAASAADAQMLAPYRGGSDFDQPYGQAYGAPPPPPPVYNNGGYSGGYGPALMPPTEVYAVLRDNGFSPLGVPHQRGFVYTIAVIDQNGEDGRLVIDARNGRIIRFVPAWGGGPFGNYEAERMSGYGSEAALPPPTVIRGVPRPPASVPHVASRAVPLPAPKPVTAARPSEPAQQSATIEAKPRAPAPAQATTPPAASTRTAQTNAPPVQASAPPAANTTVGEVRPAPAIRPTQQMPAAQGLE
jgi:hypothetical protein